MRPTRFLPFLLLALAGCGERVRDDHFSNTSSEAPVPAAEPQTADVVAVRVGELGASFEACTGVGTTRNVPAGGTLPVRSAPFEGAPEAGAIAAGGRFHVCTGSHDQRWSGIVWDEASGVAERCGVSTPLPRRQDYAGPCRSGWVPSAFVKLAAA